MASIVQYLNEAHATERALVTTLQAHLAMTPPGAHRELLERHLTETRRHARAIEQRLADLDAGPGLISATIGLAETLVGQALALAKGPVDLLRGGSVEEKQLKNAKDECATEALEIATYDGLEALAEAPADAQTARLAAALRAVEERTLAAVRDLIPTLARAVAGEGGAAQDELAIEGYDALNAGQGVARLAELSQAQLRAVAAYERAGRGRRTVLERIDALQAEEPWPGYDEASEAAVIRRLGGADPATVARVRDYAARHRRRVAVLEAAQPQPAR